MNFATTGFVGFALYGLAIIFTALSGLGTCVTAVGTRVGFPPLVTRDSVGACIRFGLDCCDKVLEPPIEVPVVC